MNHKGIRDRIVVMWGHLSYHVAPKGESAFYDQEVIKDFGLQAPWQPPAGLFPKVPKLIVSLATGINAVFDGHNC